MVDIVHHAMIGLIGAAALQSTGNTELAVGFAVGSIVPDIDVAFAALGKARFLRLHQGVTHSPIGIAMLSILVSASLHALGGVPFGPLLAGVAAGMAIHVCFDLLNTFGVRVLWPLPTRVSLDAVFFVDVYLLALSVAALATMFAGYSPPAVAFVWAASICIYVAVQACARRAIVQRHGLATAVPSGVLPLTWFVTAIDPDDGAITCGTVPGLSRKPVWSIRYPATDSRLLAALRTGPVFADLEKALKLFIPVDLVADGDVLVVTSRCVAVPNFGNNYGLTVSQVSEGRVVGETSNL